MVAPVDTSPEHDMMADEDLLERFSQMLRSRRSALAAMARSEGASPEDAVDCVQDAFYSLLLAARRGSLPNDENEWHGILATMVRNAARNGRRRHFRARPHDDIETNELASDAETASDELIARAEEHVRLRACVEDLCEIQKAVVTLRMLEEQPGEDVAKTLGITSGHVAVLLHRAKQSLRVCMTS